MLKKIGIIFAAVLVLVLTVSAVTVTSAEEKSTLNVSVVTTDANNDLLKTLNENYNGIKTYSTLDAALDAVDENGTVGIMILADNYPNNTTVITNAQAQKINDLGVRVYVEYPTNNEAVGIDGYNGTKKMGYDRAIVTDAKAMGMDIYSLLYVHGAQYVMKTDISDSWMVNATVVGYDTVEFYDSETGELTDCTPYSMLELNDSGNVLIASTKLSQFIGARYAPYVRWQSLWMSVISWVADADVNSINKIKWTPAVNPNYGPEEALADNAYSEAVRLNTEWFLNSGLLVNSDGSEGLMEAFQSGNHFNVYGEQSIRKCLRSDCNGESLGAIALAAQLLGNEEYKTVAYNLMDWLLNESELANGVRADSTSAQYGLLSWHDGAMDQYYGDDNAKAILGLMLGAAALETEEFDERILEAILANFRTTGVNGFRGSMLKGENLENNGWKYYYNRTGTVNYRSHFESLLWGCYLWAYDQTGYEPLLERTKTAISMMMAAYDNAMAADADNNDEWFWTNGMQQERAKMILPLAWLVRIEPTEEHIGWLDKMITDMMAYQDSATGALREVKGENGVGAPVYTQFEKNSDYGQHESPVIQNNGDPCTDALYTSSFAMMTLNEAYAAMNKICNTALASKYKNYTRTLSDYFVRIQQISDTKPQYNGVWFRGFDYEKWETYGSDGDAGWGIWCVETGWCQSWISAALSMQVMNTNIWDYTQTTTVDDCFFTTAVTMLEYDPGKPTASSDKSMRGSVDLLVDGAYGSAVYSDGKWSGFEGADFAISIDYKYARKFDYVQVGAIHNMTMGISSPGSIVVYASENGETYAQIGVWNTTKDLQSEYDNRTSIGTVIERIVITVPPNTSSRYLKVEYKNPGTFLKGTAATKTWMFSDEIELKSNEATIEGLKSLIDSVAAMNLSNYQPLTVFALEKEYKEAVVYYNAANHDLSKLQDVYDDLETALLGLKANSYAVTSYNVFSRKWGDLSRLTDEILTTATLGGQVLKNLSTLEEQKLEVFVDMGESVPVFAIGYAAQSTPTSGIYLQNAEFFVSDSMDGPWVSVGTVIGKPHEGTISVAEYRTLGTKANGESGRYVKVVFSRNADNEVTSNGHIYRSEWLFLTEIYVNKYYPVSIKTENATATVKGSDGKELSMLGARVGDDLTVSVKPKTGYYSSSVTLNGAAVALTDKSFNINYVTGAQAIDVTTGKFAAADLPTIRVKDWFITPGQDFDPLTDIYACDKSGNDISSSVTVIANNIKNAVGTYTVTYYVEDAVGASIEASTNVHVVSSLDGKKVIAITPSTKDNLLNMANQMVDGVYAPDGSNHGAAALVSWQNTAYIEIVIALGENIGIADLGYSLIACPTYGFLPPDVDFYVADVLGEWTKVATIEAVLHPYAFDKYDYMKKHVALDDVKGSYVKAVIRFDDDSEMLANYASTPGRGKPEWTFADEIMINPYYSVTAGDTANGNISIQTSNNSGALYGESATLTFTPDAGYVLSSVKINGVNVKVNGNTLTLSDIRKHCTVEATFSEMCIKSASVSLGDSIALIYYALIDDASNAEIKFTMNGNTVSVSGFETDNVNVYSFPFENISPQCMGDIVRAELFVDGESVDIIEQFSVRMYADSMLKKISDKAIDGYTDEQYAVLKSLIADMLEYGAMAQHYVDYKNTDGELVNNGIDGVSTFEKLSSECDATLDDSTSEDLYFVSAGVRFDYLNSIYYKFGADSLDNVTVKITNKTTGAVKLYDAKDFALLENGVYVLYSEAIAPTEFDIRYQVELCENKTAVQTLEYGVSAYVYYMQEKSTEMADLARALYNYGKSASNYVDKIGG